MTSRFTWIDLYQEFANALKDFANNRSELINKIVRVYDAIDMRLPKLEEYGKMPYDMDPFTIFGLFNKDLKDENRVRILARIKQEFDLKATVPTEFFGIPFLHNQMATLYRFENERDENDIDTLWTTFLKALQYAEDKSEKNAIDFADSFDLSIKLKQVKWNLTMGLYWVRPRCFMTLDTKSRHFIGDTERNPVFFPYAISKQVKEMRKPPSGQEYLRLNNALLEDVIGENKMFKSFPHISHEAWLEHKKKQEEGKTKKAKSVQQELIDDDIEVTRYWAFSPGTNAEHWQDFYDQGIMSIEYPELGDLSQYDSKEEIRKRLSELSGDDRSRKNTVLACWQFVNEMNIGDIVFAKKGKAEILGRGIVTSAYRYGDSTSDSFKNVRNINWTHIGKWKSPAPYAYKTLTDLTNYTEDVEKINGLFISETDDEIEETQKEYPPYSKKQLLNEVFLDESEYETLVHLLRKKKNLILQGAPGTGKSFAAKRLAYSMMHQKNPERVMMIQFHQSYSYEDFIMGFRPTRTELGFELKKGPFYNFCKLAESDSENEYFFIIDEINRGNLSKIFGELFLLIESDKRDIPMRLLYSNEKFAIPANLHIIGMMNTADRSLAFLDYALRRRFAFYEFKPAFQSSGFEKLRKDINNTRFDKLVQTTESLNKEISSDETLGRGFCIGHSFFCVNPNEQVSNLWLESLVSYELIPLLEEYWFDDAEKVKHWSNRLRESIR